MYTLIKNMNVRRALVVEVPGLVISIIVAELFYKFHSFTLECVAFLATWLVASAVFEFLGRLVKAISPARS